MLEHTQHFPGLCFSRQMRKRSLEEITSSCIGRCSTLQSLVSAVSSVETATCGLCQSILNVIARGGELRELPLHKPALLPDAFVRRRSFHGYTEKWDTETCIWVLDFAQSLSRAFHLKFVVHGQLRRPVKAWQGYCEAPCRSLPHTEQVFQIFPKLLGC